MYNFYTFLSQKWMDCSLWVLFWSAAQPGELGILEFRSWLGKGRGRGRGFLRIMEAVLVWCGEEGVELQAEVLCLPVDLHSHPHYGHKL